jgi:hypothetical protein
MTSAIGSSGASSKITESTQSQLTMSFEGAQAIADQPQNQQYASQITEAAKQAFLQGDQWAYLAGLVMVVIGMLVVWRFYPKHSDEVALKAEYAKEAVGDASG